MYTSMDTEVKTRVLRKDSAKKRRGSLKKIEKCPENVGKTSRRPWRLKLGLQEDKQSANLKAGTIIRNALMT